MLKQPHTHTHTHTRRYSLSFPPSFISGWPRPSRPQVRVPRPHGGPALPDVAAAHAPGAGPGGGGTPDLERRHVPPAADQTGMSTDIWLTPLRLLLVLPLLVLLLLHVRLYHGSGSVDAAGPGGRVGEGGATGL